MAWIDIQKVYYWQPHSWISGRIDIYGIRKKLISLIGESKDLWNTQLKAFGTRTAKNPIKSGIFQELTIIHPLLCGNRLSDYHFEPDNFWMHVGKTQPLDIQHHFYEWSSYECNPYLEEK